MHCPACLAPVDPHAYFCIHCGRARHPSPPPLDPPVPCPACQHENLPASRFCMLCGTPLRPRSTGTLEGLSLPPGPAQAERTASALHTQERRPLALLHADLCGFTALAERLNPEQTRVLVDALFNLIAREVETQGGRVDVFIGDAALAVFGDPIAYGDDSRRAVQAALAIHRHLQTLSLPSLPGDVGPLQVRIGVDAGQVLVARAGLARRSSVTGAVVASAMALERLAPPGGTLVGEGAQLSLGDEFLLEAFRVEGGRRAWRVLGVAPARLTHLFARPLEPLAAEPGVSGEGPPALSRAGLSADQAMEEGRASTSRAATRAGAQARFDQLPEPQRTLVRLASLVGPVFWLELLGRLGVSEPLEALEALQVAGLVRFRSKSSIPGQTELEICHEPLREVASESNPLKIQSFSHRVIASWLEEQVGTDLAFVPLRLTHLRQGGDFLGAARLLLQASAWEVARGCLSDALGCCDRALELLRPLDAQQEAVREALECAEEGGRQLRARLVLEAETAVPAPDGAVLARPRPASDSVSGGAWPGGSVERRLEAPETEPGLLMSVQAHRPEDGS